MDFHSNKCQSEGRDTFLLSILRDERPLLLYVSSFSALFPFPIFLIMWLLYVDLLSSESLGWRFDFSLFAQANLFPILVFLYFL